VCTRQTTTKLEQTVSRSAGNHAGAVSLCAQGITMMLSGLSSAVGTCHQQGPERKVLTASQISSSSGMMRRKSSMTEFAVDKSPLTTTSVTHYLTRPKRILEHRCQVYRASPSSRCERAGLCYSNFREFLAYCCSLPSSQKSRTRLHICVSSLWPCQYCCSFTYQRFLDMIQPYTHFSRCVKR
jgi:hypothetical protein